MSSVAASGGYWIATGADEIWAAPSTVTGSIGIFGLFPEFSEPLRRLGIGVDGVATAPLAGALRFELLSEGRRTEPRGRRIARRADPDRRKRRGGERASPSRSRRAK